MDADPSETGELSDWRRRLIEGRLRDRLRIVLLGGIAIVALLAGLVWHGSSPDGVDAAVGRAAYASPGTAIRSVTELVSALGKPAIVGAASFAVGWWAWRRSGDLIVGSFPPIAVLGASFLGHILKVLIERPRPATAELSHLLDFSFPSGHATAAAALALTISLIASALRVQRRGIVVALALAYAVTVAASRVVLGVHYLSDVIAGLVVGALGVLVAGWVCTRVDLRLATRRS